jgi:4-amino-4-deoxy-L-arabinose transferase-like glycosyltransferase
VGALTLVALLLRLLVLANEPLRSDECVTYAFASASWSKLLGPDIAVETNPPVYLLLQKAWMVFGTSRLAMRCLPVLLGALAIPILHLIGRRLGGTRVGLVAASIFATAPVHVRYAREIRCYPALTLFACMAIACLLYLLPPFTNAPNPNPTSRRREGVLWVGYVTSLAVTLVLHNTALLIVPVVGLVVVADSLLRRTFDRAFAKKLLLATAVATGPFMLWLPILRRQAFGDLGSTVTWIDPMSFSVFYTQILGVFPFAKYFKPLVYSFALWTAWSLMRTRSRVACALLVVIVAHPVLLALASEIKPMFLARALLWPTAFFSVLLALGICQLKSPRSRALTLLALLVAQVVTVRDSYAFTYVPASADLAVRYVEDRTGPNDAIFTIPSAWEWNYSARNSQVGRLKHFTAVYGDTKQQLEPWIPAVLVRRERLREIVRSSEATVWVITESSPRFAIAREDTVLPMLDSLRAEGWAVEDTLVGDSGIHRILGRRLPMLVEPEK